MKLLYLILVSTAFTILLITLYPFRQKYGYPDALPTPTPRRQINLIPTTKYSCPLAEWVDCMPGPGVQKPQCESAYLTWAKANCPKFKGAAL